MYLAKTIRMTFSKTVYFFKEVCIIATFTSIFFFVLNYHRAATSVFYNLSFLTSADAAAGDNATSSTHLLFLIASSTKTFPKRKDYIRAWYNPNNTKAYVFIDEIRTGEKENKSLPPFLVHESTERFPYTNAKGHRSAVAMARMVKAAVALSNETEVRWYVFGDDDTVFFVDNVVRTLSKYDHEEWYYVGGNSESYEQNAYFSFEMGYGGGGFALSRGLAKALAAVLDSCIVRYPQLYGSDARIFYCLAELGVGLTHEPGFHQSDVWGNLFGLLSSHPQSLLLSLHHLDELQPIFPNMTRLQSLKHLFTAVNVDPPRISQQTICYDQNNSLSISLAWGFAVQVYQGYYPLPDLISVLKTFDPWDKDKRQPRFMFKTRPVPSDPCKRPLIFFFDSVDSNGNNVWTGYSRHGLVEHCSKHANLLVDLKEIKVFSNKLDNVDNTRQVKAPRRQCCDITWSSDKSMDIGIRPCGIDELTTMFT